MEASPIYILLAKEGIRVDFKGCQNQNGGWKGCILSGGAAAECGSRIDADWLAY